MANKTGKGKGWYVTRFKDLYSSFPRKAAEEASLERLGAEIERCCDVYHQCFVYRSGSEDTIETMIDHALEPINSKIIRLSKSLIQTKDSKEELDVLFQWVDYWNSFRPGNRNNSVQGLKLYYTQHHNPLEIDVSNGLSRVDQFMEIRLAPDLTMSLNINAYNFFIKQLTELAVEKSKAETGMLKYVNIFFPPSFKPLVPWEMIDTFLQHDWEQYLPRVKSGQVELVKSLSEVAKHPNIKVRF